MLKSRRGFSLIELIIGMAIFAVLLALAVPSFTIWMKSAKVRTTTESLQNGLQIARAEAVRRNTIVRFQLVDVLDNTCALSTSGPHWVVSRDDAAAKCGTAVSDTAAPRIIQTRDGAEGGDSNTTLLSDESSYLFNGMGRLTSAPSQINVSVTLGGTCIAAGGQIRCLRITVSAGGEIRMCDPALPTTDAQGC